MSQQGAIGCVSMMHLGLNHSAAFAEKGFNVICYDENSDLIEELQKHNLPIIEPGLDELIAKNTSLMQFTYDVNQLSRCDLVFIACDVPTDDAGNSDLSIIYRLVELIKPVLSEKACLVLLSQVPPGFTRKIDLPKERLFYQVETLIFGEAVERALYPERYIVGTNNSNQTLPEMYFQLLNAFDCPILKMRYESAELAKIAINLFLVSSVSTTNTLAEICESVGADWREISPALRLDKRIGEYAYLNPGLGIAGGNLERDLTTIIQLGQQYSTNTSVVQTWLQHSQYCRDWVWRCLSKNILNKIKDPRICILGLAYKPNTDSIKNSQSMLLLKQLEGYTVFLHDPVVKIDHIGFKDSLQDAISEANIVIIMTPWDQYSELTFKVPKNSTAQCNVVIDPYHVLKINCNHTKIMYFSLGEKPIASKEAACFII